MVTLVKRNIINVYKIEHTNYYIPKELYSYVNLVTLNENDIILAYVNVFGTNGKNKYIEDKKYNSDKNLLIGYLFRFGIIKGIDLYNQFISKQRVKRDKNFYISKYGQIKGEKIWEQRHKMSQEKTSLVGYIKRYGKIEGLKKWNEYKKTCSNSHSLEHNIEKYGKELGTKKWNNFLKRCSKSKTLENFISIYGEIEGNKKYKEFINGITVTEHTYIEKYGELEGKKKYKEYCKSKAITLNNLVKKYGEAEGNKKWNAYLEKQKYSQSIEGFIERYGEVDGIKKYKHKMGCLSLAQNPSKSSIEFFDNIIKYLNLNISDIKYHKDNINEFFLLDKGNNTIYFYDFTIISKKLIIEYNGLYYHVNPQLKNDINYIKRFKTISRIDNIEEKEQRDKNKQMLAEYYGYKYLIVWENDSEKFEKAIKFIKENI